MSTLWLVCDVSGSMREASKYLVVRSLVRELEQYFRFGYADTVDLQLVAWSSGVVPLPWAPGRDVPALLLKCGQSTDGAALARFISKHCGDRFLVLTDGFWPQESISAIASLVTVGSDTELRILKVGTDANPALVGPGVFGPEELFAAMEGWLDQ